MSRVLTFVFLQVLSFANPADDHPPSVYKWITDSPYICNPAIQLDGSVVNFLHEEDGEMCNKCDHVLADFVATHACGIKIRGNEVDSRIGCFELPSLCVEEYVLRYSSFFHGHGRTAPPDSVEATTAGNNLLEDGEEKEEKLKKNRPRKQKELMREEEKTRGPPVEKQITTTPSTTTTTEKVEQEIAFSNDEDDEKQPFNTQTFEEINRDIENRITDLEDDGPKINSKSEASIAEGRIVSSEKVKEKTTIKSKIESQEGQKEVAMEILPDGTRFLMMQKRKEHFFGTTTTTTVMPTTTTKAPCVDKNNLCCFWAISGECDTNPFWMRIHCAKTCGTCDCSLREADFCVSTGINCTLPSTTTTTTQATTTTIKTSSMPTTRPQPPTTRIRHTRPFTPPKFGFGRTRSSPTQRTTTLLPTTTATTAPTTPSTTSTTTTTTTTTTTPDPCQDLNHMCSFWASIGECQINPFWMRPHCQRSCKSCGEHVDSVFAPTPRKGCENTHKFCNFWASSGECDSNANWMVPNCPLSCRIC